jgi:hypothetical protein
VAVCGNYATAHEPISISSGLCLKPIWRPKKKKIWSQNGMDPTVSLARFSSKECEILKVDVRSPTNEKL